MRDSPVSTDALEARVVSLARAYVAAGIEPNPRRFYGNSGGDSGVPFWRFERQAIGRQERELAKDIVALNPTMLSRDYVQHLLRYPLLTNLIDDRDDFDNRTGETISPSGAVRRELQQMISFDRVTTVGVPILHSLLVTGEELNWGGVLFRGINPWSDLSKDDVGPELTHLIAYFNGRLNGWATVECPGDDFRVWHFMSDTIETALRQMVGAAWLRHGGSGHTPPSLPGRGSDVSYTPRFEGGSLDRAISVRIAEGHAPYRVPRDLEHDWSDVWPQLLEVAQRDERSDLERALMNALGWLGAATEPDLAAMKIVKVATALETLISEHDPNASSRGVTAMLSERTALLFPGSAADRIEVAARVQQVYKLRSDVLHRNFEADEDEIADVGTVVWHACHSYLRNLTEIQAAGGLRQWALLRRYG